MADQEEQKREEEERSLWANAVKLALENVPKAKKPATALTTLIGEALENKSDIKKWDAKRKEIEEWKDKRLHATPKELRRMSVNTSVSDTASLASSGGIPGAPVMNRLLTLCFRGEWNSVEQMLRSMEKGDPDICKADEDTEVTPLMLAAKDNKFFSVEKLLELGASVNDKSKDGKAAIHFAAASAKEDVIKLLVQKKADATTPGGPKKQLPLHIAALRSTGGVGVIQLLLRVSGKEARLARDTDGILPIFLAIDGGNTGICKELLLHHKDEQLKARRGESGDTLLHLACRKKDMDLIKLFIENGAHVDTLNEDGHTPLHLAASLGDEQIVKYFYQMKANPNIYDKLDRSPLHIAAELGHTAVVEILIDKFKASVAARTKDGSTLMHIASQCGHPETALMFLKKGVPLHMPNKSGAVCLHAAAKRGHTAVVKSLLQKGAMVDARTKENYTALHVAVQHCKPLVVQTLLGYGAQVQLQGGTAMETPLHIAARIKEGEKVAEMLLKSGADVNAVMANGETAMHIAARFGQLKMIQALLEEGADPIYQSKNGENPLHIAVRHCHYVIVKELLTFLRIENNRADAVMVVNTQSNEGETPLHYAAEITKEMAHYNGEDVDIVKILLEYEADTYVSTKLTQETPLHYCARSGNTHILLEMVKYLGQDSQLALNKQSKNGWSPLLVASEQGHVDIVKILLSYNARVDVFDEHGKAALHLASENGHKEVADVLLWHKAFVNAKSKIGLTPLHLAARSGHNDLVELLIHTHNASIDALSLAKKTPLHMAAQFGQLKVCETLLQLKADSNATDNHGQTPLHLAAENDHAEIVKLFLQHKPDLVTMANVDGSTCAHIAAAKGSVAVTKELLRFNKAGVCSARNKTNDSTALHLAAEGGHTEVVSVLLDAGASPNEENADGMTAIHLAAKSGHVKVLDALKNRIDFKSPSRMTGLGALHISAQYGQVDFVRELLQKVPATTKSESPSGAVNKDLPLSDSGLTPLHLASFSGHEGVVRLLLNSPNVQPDAPTYNTGIIPLHLAAQSGHLAVAGLLLSKSTNQLHIKDKKGRTCLHIAAANGHYEMVALLLGQGSDINTCDKSGLTALHYASKVGFLKVVKLLVESGASPKFESKDGKVPICYAATAQHYDVLSYLMKKDLNSQNLMDDKKFIFDLMVCGRYTQNISIQEFVLRSPSPIEIAVRLSQIFVQLSTKEKERTKDILAAAAFCEEIAVDLLSVSTSLKGPSQLLRSTDNRGMPFLDVLIECEQKEVVSHPSVQRYLSVIWMGGLDWASWRIILLFFTFIFLPPVWIVFSLPLKQRFNRLPIIKYMSYLVSHIFLIVLLVLTTVYTGYIEDFIANPSFIPRWHEWLLLAWFSGLLMSEITNPGDRQGLGWIRVIILIIAAIGCTVHLGIIAPDKKTKQEVFYARNQLYAWCLLLSFAQLLEFLSVHHLFGPWGIIIRDLMMDLVKFMVILCIFLFGFMLHLAAVYQPVYEEEPDSEYGAVTDARNVLDTLEILFFSVFGLVEPDSLPPVTRNPSFTLTLTKIVFGTYLIVTLIVLINLLIAMMSDTYQRIQAQSDTEWKFARAKLIRKMNKTFATPAPLNLFTKVITYGKLMIKHRGKICGPQAQAHFQEEEHEFDDTMSDTRSMDDHHQGQSSGGIGGFFRKVRRNPQVAPDRAFIQVQNSGPKRIEDVIDWQMVVRRYRAIKGFEEEDQRTNDNDDAEEQLSNSK
ncbi:serine/threonine-protein phosphatase 6 regulatory ankyrin repeat subunit C-like isoform X2 [Anneissia japonica]|uniref:serine/threonine-protein phosphatase 6 regulatory ankyrin repeat subunit C-like isoform X2 n=1 Tax=Anneissia japonica TaxID=1529436 RepID=UPI001425AF70|nr:serine/threonine-protein phosphatase 6 regulatory ankyrin repeat subunit C-like isoform X2 [Anneissia japonica]